MLYTASANSLSSLSREVKEQITGLSRDKQENFVHIVDRVATCDKNCCSLSTNFPVASTHQQLQGGSSMTILVVQSFKKKL